MTDKTKAIFATLDEPVTLASSSFGMIKTREVGRVVGFGCTSECMVKVHEQATFRSKAGQPSKEGTQS